MSLATAGVAAGDLKLQGAGATFPNPLYQKWMSEYGKLHPNVKIDYQSIGSGGGIKQLQAQTVDFGASDAPMKEEELKAAPGPVLHIPTVLGAVVFTYNLRESPSRCGSRPTSSPTFFSARSRNGTTRGSRPTTPV